MKLFKNLFVVSLFFMFSCNPAKVTEDSFTDKTIPQLKLSEAELYDKVLGQIVGSAIGDAMGAPTEMWSRGSIELEYGDVNRLDSMIRAPSPEGTWKHNLPAGGTTDDTRWKAFVYKFLKTTDDTSLSPQRFTQALVNQYQKDLNRYKTIDSFDPEPYEENTLRVGWLQEWAQVAKPYSEGDYLTFHNKLSRFYGGEMVCAGLLYAPAIGVYFPEDPERAYEEMYNLAIFDIGYARDISALAAAMSSAAMHPNATPESLLASVRNIDPQGFYKSRLVGRTSFRILQQALGIVAEAKKAPETEQRQKAFELLDGRLQDMPFHAGEIYLQTLVAMLFSDFDFTDSLTFLVNYGRDNDTTAAVAGGILGAFYGYEALPTTMKEQVVHVGKKDLEIDMKALSVDVTSRILKRF